MATEQEKNFLQFALWTGLRISELCALDWGDVDWVNKRIFVQRALTQHNKEPEPLMWVAKQMGHTDWTFTARTYSQWVSIDEPEAGNLAVQKWG